MRMSAADGELRVMEHEGFMVVRDDRYPGGTKARVLAPMLEGADEWVYASPAYGYAQVALAHVCKRLKKRATIFVAQRKQLHDRTLEARNAGAKILEVPYGYLSNVQAKARAYCESSGAQQLPFGFDTAEFRHALTELALTLPIRPLEVWTVAGSGTLTRALQAAWPAARFFAVRVGSDPDAGRARVFTAPEPFERDARVTPPFPSCANYDAKAWDFIRRHARPGALFWNVAG